MAEARLALDSNIAGVPRSLVYIAGNLVEAKRVEEVLKSLRIDYTVELEVFASMSILVMATQYVGLYVYVPSAQHELCKTALESQGFCNTIPLKWSQEG